MKPIRAILFVSALGMAAKAQAAGMPAALQPVQDLLQRASLDGGPASLAVVVLILGILPFSVIVPMTVGSFLAGALLPAKVAPAVILAGMLLNTVLSWTFAKTLFAHHVEAWVLKRGGALLQLRSAAQRSPFKWSYFSRFIPSPFFAAPMVLASAGVSLGKVVGATTLAMLPWSFAYAWAGREGREGSLKSLGLAGMGIACILLITGWAYKRFILPAELEDAAAEKMLEAKTKSKARVKAKAVPKRRKARA